MPFVPTEHREEGHTPCTPGDLCYLEYLKLMNNWRKGRHWTNAHTMTKEFFNLSSNEETARFLAWMVWFSLEVIPYEIEKRTENGPV